MSKSQEILENAELAAYIEMYAAMATDFKTTEAENNDNYQFNRYPHTDTVGSVNVTTEWRLFKQPKSGQVEQFPIGQDVTLNDMGNCLGYFFESLSKTKEDSLEKATDVAEDYKAAKITRLDAELTALSELTALITAEKANIEAGGESTLQEIKPLIEYLKTLKTNAE